MKTYKKNKDTFVLRQSRWFLIRSTLIFVIIISLSIIIIINLLNNIDYENAKNIGLIAVSLIIIATSIRYTTRIIKYMYSIIYVSTKEIIILKYGIFVKEEMKLYNLKDIQTIKSKQKGLRSTLINYGDIEFSTNFDIEIVIKKIPHPKQVIEKIKQDIKKNKKELNKNKKTIKKGDQYIGQAKKPGI